MAVIEEMVPDLAEFPTNQEEIENRYPEEEFLFAEGFDSAIQGVDEQSMRVIYSVSEMLNILMARDGMSYQDALEYFEYNIEGGYLGEKTPIWCHHPLQ